MNKRTIDGKDLDPRQPLRRCPYCLEFIGADEWLQHEIAEKLAHDDGTNSPGLLHVALDLGFFVAVLN